jgi:hypothetical protein
VGGGAVDLGKLDQLLVVGDLLHSDSRSQFTTRPSSR